MNKWQTPGEVMTRLFESILVDINGFKINNVVVHSYKDNGDHVLVNLEFIEDGELAIQRLKVFL